MVIVIILVVGLALFSTGFFNKVSTPTPTATPTATPSSGTILPVDRLSVGDSFTYNLTGSSVLGSPDVVAPQELSQYNNTEYYQVTVTGINGTQVTLDTFWQFNNGTEVTAQQVIDLSNGIRADPNGFWAIYPANLKVNELLYPKTLGAYVNATDTKTYADSTRARNFWQSESQFVDTSDPTGNTMHDEYISVYFDKQTGILESLTQVDFYTNPEIELTITWQLISSNVWAV